jgi:hypothetical protein
MDSEPNTSATQPSRKRKTASYANDKDNLGCQSTRKTARKLTKATEIVDLTADSPKKSSPKGKNKHNSNALAEEKRLKRYRAFAPQTYLAVKERAMTQRLTVLSRERCGTDDLPEEKVVMAGSTGNVYTQKIKLQPSCNCPHAMKGNQCKHIIYVMLRVLKAREDIAYQLALTSSELREVLENAPPSPGVDTDSKDAQGGQDGNRKPIEGECPICYDDLEPGKDAIVYCQTSCGNNVHKSCMQKWIAMAKNKATCPYCRAQWAVEDGFDGKLGDIDTKGMARNEDGYVNIAGELGLSGERDYSSYHQFWVRSHLSSYGGRRRDYDGYDDNY